MSALHTTSLPDASTEPRRRRQWDAVSAFDQHRHPYRFNLAIGFVFIVVLSTILSVMSGGFEIFPILLTLKSAFYLSLITGYTWLQQRAKAGAANETGVDPWP